MVVNKFGKLCGPGAESVPTANSVTSAKIFDGGVEAADLGALSVTAAKLGVDVAGDGLAGGNGAAISLDIDNLTDAVLDVAADTICFIDESADGDPTKLESVADLVTAVAGTASSTALTASSGVLTVAPTEVVTDVAADSVIIRDATDSKVHRDTIADVVTLVAGSADATGLTASAGVLSVAPTDNAITVAADSIVYATAAGATRKDLVSDVVTAVAGTETSTGLSAASGVMSASLGYTDAAIDVANDDMIFRDHNDTHKPKTEAVSDFVTAITGSGLTAASGVIAASGIGIAHMANDDKASIFYMGGEIDFGSHAAVTQDLGAIGSKATLLGGWWMLTESMANGDASETVTLGTATGGGSAIATDLTITQANTTDGLSNFPGMMRAILPNGTTSVDMADTTHLWLDVAIDAAARDAGKVSVFLILQKSA